MHSTWIQAQLNSSESKDYLLNASYESDKTQGLGLCVANP